MKPIKTQRALLLRIMGESAYENYTNIHFDETVEIILNSARALYTRFIYKQREDQPIDQYVN